MVTGLVAGALGLLLLSRITPTSSYTTQILPALIVMSTGLALFFIPSASTGLHNAGLHDAGVASAMINTSQQIGGSLGAALLNTVAISSATAFAKTHTSLGAKAQVYAQVHGFTVAFKFGAGFLAVAAIVVLLMINIGKESLVESERESAI